MQISQLHALFYKSTGVSIDTRSLQKDALFFCIKGEHHDGNKFAAQALLKGALKVIIDDPEIDGENENYILVEDSLFTLQELAKFHRKKFNIPVIGLTGSNGKTTTKELIRSVLSQHYQVLATLGNLNNQIGVPLSLLGISNRTEIALIEMGANHLNEISFLCNLAQPTHGLITNFGKAHLEGFGSIEGVIKGKSELYKYLAKNNGTTFINSDDPLQVKHANKLNGIRFGSSENDHVIIENTPLSNTTLQVLYQGILIESKLSGKYNLNNIKTAVAVGAYFNCTPLEIKQGIIDYLPENNRSQWVITSDNRILLDAYNANPTSMKAALEAFHVLQDQNKGVILGDMLELGSFAPFEHQNIVDLAIRYEFSPIILIGVHFIENTPKHPSIKTFKSTEKAFDFLSKQPLKKQTLLLKGSRGIALEKLIEKL